MEPVRLSRICKADSARDGGTSEDVGLFMAVLLICLTSDNHAVGVTNVRRYRVFVSGTGGIKDSSKLVRIILHSCNPLQQMIRVGAILRSFDPGEQYLFVKSRLTLKSGQENTSISLGNIWCHGSWQTRTSHPYPSGYAWFWL